MAQPNQRSVAALGTCRDASRPRVGVAVHLETDDVEAEVRRLEALGATQWGHQQERGQDFWVMRDPWGNEFCVLQTESPDLLTQRPSWPSHDTW